MSERIDTMINATIEQKPGDFAAAFEAEMAERTAAALVARKEELAKSYLEDEGEDEVDLDKILEPGEKPEKKE